jgi:hypothetical protein
MTFVSIAVPPTSLLVNAVARGGAAANFAAVKSDSLQTNTFLNTLSQRWFQLSEIARFFVSGNIGNLGFYLIEKTINRQLCAASSLPEFVEKYKDTFSFFFGYLLQIVVQHSLNACLVYGLDTVNTREKYLKTLLGQYSAYGCSLIGSTILNLLLLRAGVEKTVAFFVTMAVFAGVNYFVIGWMVRATARAAEKKQVKKQKFGREAAEMKKVAEALSRRVARGGGGCTTPTTRNSNEKMLFHRKYCGGFDISGGEGVNVDEVNRYHRVVPENLGSLTR